MHVCREGGNVKPLGTRVISVPGQLMSIAVVSIHAHSIVGHNSSSLHFLFRSRTLRLLSGTVVGKTAQQQPRRFCLHYPLDYPFTRESFVRQT